MFAWSPAHTRAMDWTNLSEISHKPSCFLPPGWDIFPPKEREPLWPLACCDRTVTDFLGGFVYLLLLFGFCCFFFCFFFNCLTVNMKYHKTFFFLLFISCFFPQRSARTMAEYTLSTTTHGQHSGTILGPKGETPTPHPDAYKRVWVCMSLTASSRYAALVATLAVERADRNIVI